MLAGFALTAGLCVILEKILKTIQIPSDLISGKPLVTSAMKKSCMSEFAFTRQNSCVECYEVAHENCDICGGEIDYVEKIYVPLDTCKEIYKAMATEIKKWNSCAPNYN